MRRTPLVLFFALIASFLFAQRGPRFKTFKWPISLGAGSVNSDFTMNVSLDTFNGATVYTLTELTPEGTVKPLGLAVIPSPEPPQPSLPPPPTPGPTEPPTPSPPPPIPSPPPCDASWNASLTYRRSRPDGPEMTVTFYAQWLQPPPSGWLSDNSGVIQQGPILSGVPLTWTYVRGFETQHNWALLTLTRGSSICERAVGFEIPAL